MSALLTAFENGKEEDLAAIEAALSQALARAEALQALRDGMLRKLGKQPAANLPFRVLNPFDGMHRPLPFARFSQEVEQAQIDLAVETGALAAERREPQVGPCAAKPESTPVERREEPSDGQAAPNRLPAISSPPAMPLPEIRCSRCGLRHVVVNAGTSPKHCFCGEPLAKSESKKPENKTKPIESPAAQEANDDDSEDGPGGDKRYAADLLKKQRKVITYLKTVSRAPVTKVATMCGIGLRGRNSIGPVVRYSPLFHVDQDDVVSLTAAGERFVGA